MHIQGIEYYDIDKKDTDKVFWIEPVEKAVGEHLFTFDFKKVYNLFSDYPWNLTEDEKKIFDEQNPYWKDFFKDRS